VSGQASQRRVRVSEELLTSWLTEGVIVAHRVTAGLPDDARLVALAMASSRVIEFIFESAAWEAESDPPPLDIRVTRLES
jgi:hypothetical protein